MNFMQFIIPAIIIIIAIANQAEKSKKNNRHIGQQGTKNIVPQPGTAYKPGNTGHRENQGKAFRESSTYQTSQMVNEQMANREIVIDALKEFNETLDKKKSKKNSKASKTPKAARKPQQEVKDTTVEYIDLSKEEPVVIKEEPGYGFSIFDDFAASDALYLARKDVEKRKMQDAVYI